MTENKNEALEVIRRAATVEFTTINNDGYPVTRAMFNLRSVESFPALLSFMETERDIFLTTNTSLSKINDIKTKPKCSAYFFLPNEFRGVTVIGDAEIVTDMEIKKRIWQKGWEMYYPGGVTDTEYSVIQIHTVAVKGYRQLTHYSIPGDAW